MKSAFSLLELIFAIVVLGIVASFAIPKYIDTKDTALVSTIKRDINTAISSIQGYYLLNQKIDKISDALSLNDTNWIITDMRFPNEMEAVKKRGGITIRVNRPCDICGGSGYHKMSCPVSKSGEHYSETAIDKSEFDYIINNDSDIQSLIEKVRIILVQEKII